MWKQIEEFPNYSVSDEGEIKSSYRSCKILKPKIDKDGYHSYCLRKDNKNYHRRVHRIVAETFLGNPDNHPVVNHKNSIKDDNRVDNLEWCTVAYNTIHGYKNNITHRTLSSLSTEDFKELVDMYQKGSSYSDIVKHFNLRVRQDMVGDILSGRRLSSVSGITTDLRMEYKPKVSIEDGEVLALLKEYHIGKVTQQVLVEKYQLSPAQVNRIVHGKRRVDLYNKFLELQEEIKETK